jgi:hypothetical protein
MLTTLTHACPKELSAFSGRKPRSADYIVLPPELCDCSRVLTSANCFEKVQHRLCGDPMWRSIYGAIHLFGYPS